MKKIFKRLVAAGLGVTIVAGSLAGCSSGSGTGETQAASQAETTAAESASGDSGQAAETEELVAEEGAEIEIAYWEGSQSDKDAWDWAIAKLKEDHPEITITTQIYPSEIGRAHV